MCRHWALPSAAYFFLGFPASISHCSDNPHFSPNFLWSVWSLLSSQVFSCVPHELGNCCASPLVSAEVWLPSRLQVKVLVAQSCPTLCNPTDPARLLCLWDFPGKDTGVGCHSLLQGIFPDLLYCRQILFHLSHLGSPKKFNKDFKKKKKRIHIFKKKLETDLSTDQVSFDRFYFNCSVRKA